MSDILNRLRDEIGFHQRGIPSTPTETMSLLADAADRISELEDAIRSLVAELDGLRSDGMYGGYGCQSNDEDSAYNHARRLIGDEVDE